MNLRTGLKVLAAACGLALLVLLRDVVLILFLGILLAVVMGFPINFLSRKIPRGLAVILVLLVGAGFFTGIGFLTYSPLAEQVGQLTDRLPEGVQRMQTWFASTSQSSGMAQLSPDKASVAKSIKERMASAWESLLSMAGPAAMSAGAVLSGLVVIVVLGAFFAHEPKLYARSLRDLLPKDQEGTFDELWLRLGGVLRSWMGGILISMTIMGTVTAVGLLIAGVQDWFILGFLTFLGTFTPYVGAIASAIPGLILALSQSNQHFFGAMVVYLVVHLVEGYVVEPMVMKRAVVIHPGTMLVWQLAMGSLFGLLGIMVATPLLACIKVTVGFLYVERNLGKELEAL